MRLKKFKNLKVRPGAKSSRFVVDLKRDLTEAETKEINDNKSLVVESRLEKLAELDYGKIFKTGSENAKKNFAVYAKMFCRRDFWIPAFAKAEFDKQARDDKKETNSMAGKIWREIDQLAFISLGKLLYIALYKVCYVIGWVIMFILRLVFFILLAIAKPIAMSITFIADRFRLVIVSGSNIILKSFEAARSAGQSASVKLSAWPKQIFQKSVVTENNIITPLEEREYKSPQPPLLKGVNTEYNPPNPLYQGGILKPVLVFAGVLLLMVLPLKGYTYYKTIDSAKGKVLGASESAMNNLISGGEAAANFNFNQADESFTRAGNNFLAAENQLKEINGLLFTLGSIVPDKNIQLAAASKHLVRAGGFSAAAGKNLSLAMASLFNYQAGDSRGIILNLTVYGHKAIENLTDLDKELAQINSEAIPEAYQKKFILLKQETGELTRGLSEFIGLADKLEIFLGHNALKRYLLIFQNNSEMRASGGFIGSFALVDFLNGKIKSLVAPGGGSYDTEAGLLKKIKAPEPLSLVRPDWHFWDANWWPDWPTSARKLAWFYENSDGSTVDGVIGFTPTVMEKILKIIGPIDLKEKYGAVIDADNFWAVTQKFAEQRPEATKQPKKIIGDLMDKIIEELPTRLNKDNLIPLLKAVEELLSDKNILFYFADSELQTEVSALGWTGEIKKTAGDYLSVINTNIAGGKSDRRIKQAIIHQAEIQPDGTIIDNLTIRRTHQALKGEQFTGVRNVDWVRVYVPLGSELISAEGFKPVDKIFFKEIDPSWRNDPEVQAAESQAKIDAESNTKIYSELDKTVFANWSQLDPGQTIEIKIKYQLPFKITDEKIDLAGEGTLEQFMAKAGEVLNPEQKNIYSYSMLLQKQPGMNSSTIESELKLSDNFKTIWRFPDDLELSRSGWSRTENFDQDKIMAVMVEEK